jgi:arylsulfate sulfotransferase
MLTFCSRACLLGLLALPLFGAVKVVTLAPSQTPPQLIGTAITWTVKATDTAKGPLTFQFNVAPPGGSLALVKDFNVGVKRKKTGIWEPPTPFIWTPTGIEGKYRIQVVVKDFKTGRSSSQISDFQVNPLVTGDLPVTANTANPLVALFSAPACASGSLMRVFFQEASQATPANTTNWVPCNPSATMTFEIAGMYPSTAYQMFAQVETGSNMVNGPPVSYTTGALPSGIPFPASTVKIPPQAGADTTDSVLLHSITRLSKGVFYPDVATDLTGKTIWYYRTSSNTHANLLTRPLQGGGILSIELGPNWNHKTVASQIVRQLDLAGNIIRETNTGILQQQLIDKGETNAGACTAIHKPAPVGSACMGGFHHEAMQALPNGYTAVLADIEKIFPPGTQGDTTGLPVDIVGDIIIVLDANWQVVWYFDTFEHDTGPQQLDITRPAVLNETCYSGFGGCPPLFLTGNGVAPKAHDWLHGNTIYYWPTPQDGSTKGDILFSSRHQDWVLRISYQDATGDGHIIWRMGPGGDFTFNNVNGDPWPWFSHQHEVAMENDGAGPMSIFDNGNTRVSNPGVSTGGTPGLGTACGPADCNNRGMALNVDETTMQVTPVLSQDLGYFSSAMGSAQLLYNGNYFFLPALVALGANHIVSFNMQLLPTGGSVNATTVLNVEGTEVYRSWQMPSMYAPPIS